MHIAVERDLYGAMPQNFGERFNIKAQLDAIGSKKVAERMKIERSRPVLISRVLKRYCIVLGSGSLALPVITKVSEFDGLNALSIRTRNTGIGIVLTEVWLLGVDTISSVLLTLPLT